MKTETNIVPIGAIERSPTNPRTRFDEEQLRQLGETIRAQGILQRLLVRPWPGRAGVYECVDGERRLRASRYVGLTELPVDVRELTDAQVVAIQLITGETGEPLSPIEEASGYRTALALVDAAGQPCYTLRSLAEKIGCSHEHIRRRTCLLELPKGVQEAILDGALPARTATLIAQIPGAEDRTQAAAEIVKPQHRTEPLTFLEAEQLIRERYTVSLRSAPFDVKDPALLGPEQAPLACVACDFAVMREGSKRCTQPACYRAKCNFVWDRAATAAKAKGRQVLSDEEAERVFEAHANEPELRPDSPYVDLNSKPTYRHVSNAVEDKKLPTWRELIAGAEEKGIAVPVVEARHVRSGRRFELVRLEHAIEAAKQIGEDIFRKDNVGLVVRQTDDFAERKKQEQEAAKRRLAESCLGLVALHQELAHLMQDTKPGLTAALFPIAVGHAGADGQALVAKALGLKSGGGDFAWSDALDNWYAKAKWAQRHALIPVLLVAADMKWKGIKSEGWKELAALAKIHEPAIVAAAAAPAGAKGKNPAAGANSKKKKPGKEETGTTSWEKLDEVKKAVAGGASAAEIAVLTAMPMRHVDQALEALGFRGAGPWNPPKPQPKKKAAVRVQITDGIRSEVRRLVEAGKTGAQIAKLCGISLPSVQNIKKALGFVKARALKRDAAAAAVAAVRGSMKKSTKAA